MSSLESRLARLEKKLVAVDNVLHTDFDPRDKVAGLNRVAHGPDNWLREKREAPMTFLVRVASSLRIKGRSDLIGSSAFMPGTLYGDWLTAKVRQAQACGGGVAGLLGAKRLKGVTL